MKRFYIILALIVILALLCLVVLGGRVAHASMCGRRADFIKALNDKYQESGKAMGIAGQINLVELFTSKAGTWTFLVTTPEGRACIIAAGTNWTEVKPQIAGEKS